MGRDRRNGETNAGWQNRRLYLPAYRVSEAARLASTTPQTIARWYKGYEVPGHRIRPVLPSDGSPLLSYLQLVEVAFVATFRRIGVKLESLRNAREYCVKTFSSEYPFAELRFKTDGVHVFRTFAEYEEDGLRDEQFVATDIGGQLAWAPAIADRISQFDYEAGLALRWHPRGRESVILVDPRIAFGAPIIGETGVPTWVVKDRIQAGEDLNEIEEDFGLSSSQLEEALVFEDVTVPAAA
jgi:uncharacterized protein (DUF433 family)